MRAVVVGKFSPLHRGHHALLDQASEETSSLHIISYSNPEYEHCEALRRFKWLRTYYPRARVTVLTKRDFFDSEGQSIHRPTWVLPHNDAPDEEQQCFFIWLLNAMNVEFDVLYGNESYVDQVSDLLAVKAARGTRIPQISATQIRNGLIPPWFVCRPQVAADQVCRVAILGAESTGKSTLAKALAAKYRTAYVEEYGRAYYERKSGISHPDELRHIAEEQVRLEHSAAYDARTYLFCDTTAFTTKIYSQMMFGRVESELNRISDNHYDVLILCATDIPFVQDGTRLDATTRREMHSIYAARFNEFSGLKTVAYGSIEQRVNQFYDNVVCFRPPLRPPKHHFPL